MKNSFKRIMQSRYKFLFVGILIVLFVFVIGATTIILLSDVIQHDNVYYEDVLVQDKYVDNNTGRYVIVDDRFNGFEAFNDSNGKKLYEQVHVGQRYNVVAHESFDHDFVHVVRVDNATS